MEARKISFDINEVKLMKLSFFYSLNHLQLANRVVMLHKKTITDSANIFTILFPPNSDHVMIHLQGYNYCSLYTYSKRGLNWVAIRM